MATVSERDPARIAPRVGGSERQPWGVALTNRRFRTLLLFLAAPPIVVAYLWFGVIQPLMSERASDYIRTYMAGARVLAGGGDPYGCNVGNCLGYSHNLLFYPPMVFWFAQPLVGLEPQVGAGIALLAVNLFLLLFVWLTLRALHIRDWQVALVILLATISFAPTMTEIQNRHLQVLVLVLSAIVLFAWMRGDRWPGGVALGLALAIKLIQAPLLVLSLWGRRFVLVVTALGTWAVLWIVAAPQYLPEYVLKVAPQQAQGSAEVINVAPMATFNRLLHPETLYSSGGGRGVLVLPLTAAFTIAVVAFTAWRLRSPRADGDGRALELAAGVAASPLLVTLVYAGQFILMLLPMIVLFAFGLRSRSRGTVIAIAMSWFLIGPSFLAFTNALAAGFSFGLLFQVWANSPVAGVIVLWLTSLHALKQHRSGVAAA